MSRPLIKKYSKDLTGRDPNNLILNEPHTLQPQEGINYRVIALHEGAFYTEGLEIRDDSGQVLEPHNDYVAVYLLEEITSETGLEVCAAIVFNDPQISSNVFVDYQCVGGEYATIIDAVKKVLDYLEDDEYVIEWGAIKGKPSEFTPGGHLHALWELYGFEYLVTQLERVTQAIIAGDQAVLANMREYIEELHKDAMDALADHEASRRHPYATTTDIGFTRLSTLEEAWEGENDQAVITPATLTEALSSESPAMADLWEQINQLVIKRAMDPLLGMIADFPVNTVPHRKWIGTDGQLVLRTDYPRLWQWARDNAVIVDDSVWSSKKGAFSYGDNSTTFRIPLIEQYRRPSGPIYNEVGNYLNDETRSHLHTGVTDIDGLHNHVGNTSSDGSHTHTGGTSTDGSHKHSGSTTNAGSHDHSGSTSYTGKHKHPIDNVRDKSDGWGQGGGGNAVYGDEMRDGRDTTYTEEGGTHSHTLDINNAGTHSHSLVVNNAGNHNHSVSVTASGIHNHTVTTVNNGLHTHSFTSDETGGDETRPKSVIVRTCIYVGADKD